MTEEMYLIDGQKDGAINLPVPSSKIKKLGGSSNASSSIDVYQIILTAVSLTTLTKDSSNRSQNGKSVIVNNASNSTIIINIESEENFISTYTKFGTGTLTFTAGTGVTLIQFNGTNVIESNSRACLVRIGTTNNFILYA